MKKITGWLILLSMVIAIDSFAVLLLSFLFEQPVALVIGNSVLRLVGIILSKVSLYCLVIWLIHKKNKLFDAKVNASFSVLLIFLFINVIINMVSILTIYKQFNIQNNVVNILAFSFACTSVIVIAVYEKILVQSKVQLELQLYRQQENLQKKYLLAIESSTQEMKRIKHDFANHMMCVLGYLETKNYGKLEQYIHRLYMPLESTDDIIIAGHPVISSMIYSKMLSAKKDHISIKVEGGFEKEVFIDDIDLCILIGNVLDNAIEACLNVDEDLRTIIISIQTKKDWFLLDCKNPIKSQAIIKKGNTLLTNKKDKNAHGIGLQNIRKVAEKYCGDVSINLCEQAFEIRVTLKNS